MPKIEEEREMIMKEAELKKVKEKLSEDKKQQALLKTEYSAIEEKERETNTTIDELLDELKEAKQSLKRLGLEKREIVSKHNPLIYAISDFEAKLSEHYKEEKVRQMVAEHPDFYSVLIKRLKVKLEEFQDTLNIVEVSEDPAAIVERIRGKIEEKGIDAAKVTLREGKVLYDDDVRYMCLKRYNNEGVPLDFSKKVIRSIDRYLDQPEVSRFWYVQ